MKFEVKHIYDSTVADKNAIVANALQFNIVAGSDIETTPSTANTYRFYYNGAIKPFLTTNQLSTNYYFKKDQWENVLTLESGNRYFDCEKLVVKVFLFATEEEIILTAMQEEIQEESSLLKPNSAKIIDWVSPLVLVQKEGELERPANVAELAQNYALKLTAINLSISSTNEQFSQWSPKLIDYHYWLNQATDQYIDIPISPLAFPLEIGEINEQNILNNFSFDFTLTLGKKDQTNQIVLLKLTTKKLVVNQGYLFLQPETALDNTYKIIQTSTNNGETLIASHIQLQEAKFSALMTDLSAGREDLTDYHIYLTIKVNTPEQGPHVAGVQDFQYLTTLNLIFREKPFFKGKFQDEDLTWTLDKNDLTNYPWSKILNVQQIMINRCVYNAGASFKFNFTNANPQLCGQKLFKYVLYESDDKGVHYYRLLELEPNQDNLNEAIYTVIRRSTAANIQYGIGIITIDKNGYLLETPFDNILKINSILPIGRISTPIALINNCVADEVTLGSQSKIVVLKPQLKIVDYGGDNKTDSNINKLPILAEHFHQTVNLSCTVEFEYSQNKKFLNPQTKKVKRIINLEKGQSYQSINWSNLFDEARIQLTDSELSATLYLRAKISFVYGCQDNIDLLICETPVQTHFGLKKLPTVSYLKNQLGINTPNLADNEVIGITSTIDKSLIRLLNGSEHYSSVNINTRNLQEFIINCGSWDDAEFGYTNFQVISDLLQDGSPQDIQYEAVTIPDINDTSAVESFNALWESSIDLYIRVQEHNVNGDLIDRINYSKIYLRKGYDWKEVCKGFTTIYKIKNNLSYEWLYDISHSKFTVVQE